MSDRLIAKISRFEPDVLRASIFTNDGGGSGRVTLKGLLYDKLDSVIQFNKFGERMECEVVTLGNTHPNTFVIMALRKLPSGNLLLEIRNKHDILIMSCVLTNDMIVNSKTSGDVGDQFVEFETPISINGVRNTIDSVGI